ncbi:MBL fold metallo-hydrolase [Mesorhizobium microcysteis]|uniref:MBL fold metallo-hydrolase n=1 Tax=Neoaquamicrobium microcysteis TaxID=2682781 RepID=A0A5D4H3L1_9HYPH|nr:MBL fold metallo-hydrolase [Mesorhizobium microcysteis]TYR34843.1 MBL fold metallo-hydrolase [Mesorhizobium microcysteis]
MEIGLFGGFGEKGRTSIGVKSGETRLMLDAGIKVGAALADYHPKLLWPAGEIDALLLTHAHEDHAGALSWLLAQGFRGRILMTAETRSETPATLAGYADAADLAACPFPRDRIEIFEPGETLSIGAMRIETGRSGHVVGGVWFAVDDGSRRFVHCGDVVPDSGVFVMDTLPECDLIALDASYGADPISGVERARAIAAWVDARPAGCLLPTPLSGRSLELMAALSGPFAIHTSMREALAVQIDAGSALAPGMAERLHARLSEARDWSDGESLPALPLLADDGMGKAGPSARLLPRAADAGFPILLSGHLPEGSPGQLLHAAGRADWIRMPTHPTLPGNVAIWEGAGRPAALGHSCVSAELVPLGTHIPALRLDSRTGDVLTI